jgi:hypothetical protein
MTKRETADDGIMCKSCTRELPTRYDVHEISGHGPFCFSCAKSAEGIPFAQWLDEQWEFQQRGWKALH